MHMQTVLQLWLKLSKSFFNQSVLDKNSYLHYLLPLPRTGFVDKLRSRYSISRKQQKLPDFNIPFQSTPLTITKLNLSPIVPALFVLLLCSIVFYCDID